MTLPCIWHGIPVRRTTALPWHAVARLWDVKGGQPPMAHLGGTIDRRVMVVRGKVIVAYAKAMDVHSQSMAMP